MPSSFNSTAPLLAEIFSLHAKWRSNNAAVVCGEQRLNWRELSAANHQLAHGLISSGLVVGDRVGVVMNNGIPMLQTLMACMTAGLVSVPINLSVNDDALVNMMNDAGVSAIVVSDDQLERVEALLSLMPSSLKINIATTAKNQHWQSIGALCAGQSSELPVVNYSDLDALNIIYSSGTTGMPKGIVHTQAGRRDWAYDLALALRYDDSAKTLITLGLYSNISWVAMLSTLLVGGTVFIHSRFDQHEFLATVQREAITHTAMVPIQYQRIIDCMQTQSYDVSSMRSMMSCGSPLHTDLKQKIFECFPCGIIELYGLTEGIITTLSPDDAEGRWSSVGKPLMGTDIAIVDDNDQWLDAGSSGEIISRGRITMTGYFNRPDANQESLLIDSQGRHWLRSGDIGYVDDEGFLFIVDRKKDMILSGGQNIYPQDIESIVIQHPMVNEVAVIGAKSHRWGETPVALVVKNANHNNSAVNEIKQWANQQLGRQQRLADVILIDELPRNANGKILKRELRQNHQGYAYD